MLDRLSTTTIAGFLVALKTLTLFRYSYNMETESTECRAVPSSALPLSHSTRMLRMQLAPALLWTKLMVKESGWEYPKVLTMYSPIGTGLADEKQPIWPLLQGTHSLGDILSSFIAFVLGKALGSDICTNAGGVGKPGVQCWWFVSAPSRVSRACFSATF